MKLLIDDAAFRRKCDLCLCQAGVEGHRVVIDRCRAAELSLYQRNVIILETAESRYTASLIEYNE